MFLCDCMCLMHLCSCLHLISISLSSVYFHEWMRDAERHRAQRHIRGDSSPAPFHSPAPLFLLSLSSSFPPLCCSAEPALLPYLLPPLLPKPGCTLRPLCLSVFSLSLSFFRWCQQSWAHSASCLLHTHLIYKTTKKAKNEWKEESQNKTGTAVAMLFLAPPHPPVLASRKTHFQKFLPPDTPPFLITMQRYSLPAEMNLCFNVYQLNVVI